MGRFGRYCARRGRVGECDRRVGTRELGELGEKAGEAVDDVRPDRGESFTDDIAIFVPTKFFETEFRRFPARARLPGPFIQSIAQPLEGIEKIDPAGEFTHGRYS